MLLSAEVDSRPILDLDTTPLIDVLLVLLVMFIITVPLQTHAVKIDLPTSGPAPVELVNPTRNEVAITRSGMILWNGRAVTKAELASLLVATRQLHPEPELHLRPDAGARYALVDEILAMTKRAQVTRMGFVGNEAYARF